MAFNFQKKDLFSTDIVTEKKPIVQYNETLQPEIKQY